MDAMPATSMPSVTSNMASVVGCMNRENRLVVGGEEETRCQSMQMHVMTLTQ